MTRSTRMLLMNSGKDKEPRRRRVGVEYEDWSPMDHYGPYMPSTYGERPMEPESAFYDRRGRRHYNNGRYAPRSDYMPMEPWSDAGYDHESDERRRRGGEPPRMIGFGRGWREQDMRSDATMPHLVEMDRLKGQQSQKGMAYSDQLPRFDQKMAREWTSGMVNADGTKGPHWTMEETNKLLKQYGLDCDPAEFWTVMNSLYSDYCEALRESSASTPEVYVRLARAWLKDKDAVPDKAAAYYTYIVEH